MAVVSFWGNNTKETGQTLSVVALGTEMAIDHNNKILIVSTGFNETTMEDCFWEKKKNNGIIPENGVKTGGIANGFEGLIKVIQSNRTSSNIISLVLFPLIIGNKFVMLWSNIFTMPKIF